MTRSNASQKKSSAPASKATTRKASAATAASKTTRGGRATTPRAKLTRCGFPSEFQCSSGELLWGHVNTVIEGASNTTIDTPSGPKERLSGGTILQNNFSYRVAAKRGTWKVREVQVGDYATVHVCHHASVDAADLVQRVARVGISNMQTHSDRRIVYVNRYDWSWHHRPGAELIKQMLAQPTSRSRSRRNADDDDDDDDDDDEASEHLESLVAGRFLLLDKDGYDALLATLRQRPDALQQDSYALVAPGSEEAFGIHISDANTEYELGWMVFGDDDGDEKDSLVGFVYDGAYCVFGHDDAVPLVMEGTEIPRLPATDRTDDE